MTLYNEMIKDLNESYENSQGGHNYADDVKEMQSAPSIEKTLRLYDSIVHGKQWNYSWHYGSHYIPILEQIINTNILRLFKANAEPSEEDLLKSLVNLHGNYNQWAEFLVKEAVNKKNLASAETHAREALSVKRKYDNALERMKGRPENSNGAMKIKEELVPLLQKMYGFGYIPTKAEKSRISDYGLNETENILKYFFSLSFQSALWPY